MILAQNPDFQWNSNVDTNIGWFELDFRSIIPSKQVATEAYDCFTTLFVIYQLKTVRNCHLATNQRAHRSSVDHSRQRKPDLEFSMELKALGDDKFFPLP